MSKVVLAGILLGLCASQGMALELVADATRPANHQVVKPVVGKHDWLVNHPVIQSLLARANTHRAAMGVGPVRLNADLCLAAQRHAAWMADTGIYQHSGLPYREIIFQGPTSADAAVQGWIASPAHHGILVSGAEVGFGYMIRNGQPYWVGVFR